MPHPEQLCAECLVEKSFEGSNPLEHAKLTVRLLIRGLIDEDDFTKPEQVEAIGHCLDQQVADHRCPIIER